MKITSSKTSEVRKTHRVHVDISIVDPKDGVKYDAQDELEVQETIMYTDNGNAVVDVYIPQLWSTFNKDFFLRELNRDLHKEIVDAFLSEQYPFGEITLFNVRDKGDRIEVYGHIGEEYKPIVFAEIDAEGNVTYVNGFVVNEENPTHKDILDKIDEVVAKIEAEGGMIKVDWSLRRY